MNFTQALKEGKLWSMLCNFLKSNNVVKILAKSKFIWKISYSRCFFNFFHANSRFSRYSRWNFQSPGGFQVSKDFQESWLPRSWRNGLLYSPTFVSRASFLDLNISIFNTRTNHLLPNSSPACTIVQPYKCKLSHEGALMKTLVHNSIWNHSITNIFTSKKARNAID